MMAAGMGIDYLQLIGCAATVAGVLTVLLLLK